ncbi:Asp-tRNA(Asn)/Glu-tRNA(Gln) amidotransferase subunit GatC [Deminuibacter soli]|uniref:Aspartyl/glutamyl-tRNA(Asn/Gln) amidotransferase subunit C n=1 Tax=Deminuibacter soli TaxID=2291815 RepID=A0A3E1NRN7_9BACT|nr:Asp-tRNA(Asn)/Glu-tRNA(Gln) amidotransferase subunit GatC [Deminuibacter soli]RFM30577.1 Asp-tRNA(Asn)/Glu-tRNA(Gln) amidotransferase subunit GatC [Deminuibacter soli]
MEINDGVFNQLAHLARLRFSEAEKASIQHDLQRMVAFVEKLNELDTTGVDPILHMSNSVNVWREDVVEGSVSREAALANAPVQDEAFFKVPKVIKK